MNKSLYSMAVLSMACTDVKSSAINTDGMYINYSVTSEGEGEGSTADVILRVGGSTSTTYVDLEEGDRLMVSVDQESEQLSQQTMVVLHSYTSAFDADTSGSTFNLGFERVDLNEAPVSVAVLPEAFELTSPEADTILSRTEDISELVITWDNQGSDSVAITVEGDCFLPYSTEEESDAGSHSIPASYFADNDYDDSSSCAATVMVERRKLGELDSAYGGGEVYGVQRRSTTFQIDP